MNKDEIVAEKILTELTADSTDNLISVQEAARRTGVEPQFIRRMIREGKIKALKLGYRTVRVFESDLIRYWKAQENG